MNNTRGRLSSDTQSIQSITQSAAARFAEPLPLPPDHAFDADAQNDLKLAALLCAIKQIADQRGTTLTDQIDTWEAGQ